MKKASLNLNQQFIYDIDFVLENTAVAISIDKKVGLLNIKTGDIVGEFGNYHTIYDSSQKIYFQENSDNKQNLRIYDALNEKIVVDNWECISKKCNFHYIILKSPNDKYHLFVMEKFRKKEDPFYDEYDNIEYLGDKYNEMFFSCTKNNKKAIYSSTKGFLSDFRYDNIEFNDQIIIYTEDNEMFFERGYYDCKRSERFNKVIVCNKYKGLMITKKNSKCSFYLNYFDCLFTIDCDDMKFVKEENCGFGEREYYFIIEKNGKFGIGLAKNKSFRTIVYPQYDNIEYDSSEGVFVLHYGHNIGKVYGDTIFPAKYRNIERLDYSFYATYEDNTRNKNMNLNCNIVKAINNSFQIVIDNCKIIKKLGSYIIYKKDDKYGILIFDCQYTNGYEAFYGYDNIKYLEKGFFEIDKDGNKGLFYNDEVLMSPKYKLILSRFNYDHTTIALKMNNDKFKLIQENRNSNIEIGEKVYKNVMFLEDVMILHDMRYMYVCNYSNEVLKKFPKDTVVTQIKIPIGKSNSKTAYKIGHDIYYKINNQFEKITTGNYLLYSTAYELDNATIVVNSSNQDEHTKKCQEFESIKEEKINQILENEYLKNKTLQKKFPMLIKNKLKV